METTAEYRLGNFLALPEDERNESEAVLRLCEPPGGGLRPAPERLRFACDACNETRVLRLWQSGACDYPPSPAFDASVYALYVSVLVFALLGNSAVVYVVCSSAKMRTVTNYFIANLAVGDLCMAVFCVPFSFLSTLILKYWPFGGGLCVAVNYLQAVSVFVSAYTLVAVSVDRYLAIIYPLRPRMTRFQAKAIIGAVWLLSLATTLPVALHSRLLTPELNFYRLFGHRVCIEDWGGSSSRAESESRVAYSVALMLLQYFLPLAVLVFTYTRIAMVVWGKRNLGETPARTDRIARSKRKMIKMMVCVVMVYTLCWLPFNVLMVVREMHDVDGWPYMVYLWSLFHWLAMSSTCYNPVILCWMNNKFRSGFCGVASALPCLRRWADGWLLAGEPELARAANAYCYCHYYSTSSSRGGGGGGGGGGGTAAAAAAGGGGGGGGAAAMREAEGSRLVTISLRDDTIVFKSGRRGGPRAGPGPYGCRRLLHQMLEDTSSESPL